MELGGKVVLVVGGAAGIGAATARLCAERGASVVVADRDGTSGRAVAADCGAEFIAVDVGDEESVRGLFGRIGDRHGRLDVLIQTAGVLRGAFTPLDAFDLATWRGVLEINTTGSFLCARHAAPLMRRAGAGVILLLSSVAATAGSSSFAYGASKGGVNSLGIVLADALAVDRIRVNVVAPGNIDTAMKRSVMAAAAPGSPQPHLGTPEGVARVLAWLASDEADYVRGLVVTR